MWVEGRDRSFNPALTKNKIKEMGEGIGQPFNIDHT
jgi:hypothetical protein